MQLPCHVALLVQHNGTCAGILDTGTQHTSLPVLVIKIKDKICHNFLILCYRMQSLSQKGEKRCDNYQSVRRTVAVNEAALQLPAPR